MTRGTRMFGSDAILRALELEGVDVAFGIPGGAILPTYDAIARGTTVRHVLARHEQGAGHMAEGYARASGKVGVAIATSGPGATNLVTPIADAWMDSTPLVCITGQVRASLIGTDAFQEIDATGITMPIVKHSWLVQDVQELPGVLKAAFHVARTGRQGPVLVDVAKDVQEAEFEFAYPDDVDLPGWKPPQKVHPRQIREAARAIAESQRPIIYAGGGVLNADACVELRSLVDSAQLPAVVTLMGKGCLPDSHPLNYGAPGMHGSKYANWALNKADLVIAVGSRFDDRVTGKVSAFAPGAKVIHFDIDAAEVGKIRHAEIPVVGPLKLALAQLADELRALDDAGRTPQEPWLRQLEDWRAQFPFRYAKADGQLKPQTAIEALRDVAGDRDDVIWTTGVGQHQMWAMQYLVCDQPRSFITSGGLGTMGYGLPAAIGAKAARPDATVVCIDGDGCFQMTCQELATAALERLPVVAVVINNGWLGMVRQWQEMFYDERFAQTHLTHAVPDYAQLAEAFGCAGFTVESEDQLEDALRAAFTAGRSAVVDVRCDPEEKVFPMVPAGAAAVDVMEAPDEQVMQHMSAHTISVRLENKPGALARVSQLFSRRGYNIQSLAVGPTERSDISRLTLRVDCSEHSLEQIEKQMHKLVNVLRVTELRPDEAVERELALFTVSVSTDKRAELVALSQVAGARVADVGRDAITFEFVGRPDEVEAFEELVRPYGVRELVRTGRVGLRRPSAGGRTATSSVQV